MIVLAGAGVHLDDRTCLVSPLHVACVGAVATEPWQDTPESQQQFDNIHAAYPGARAEILLGNGRAIFVLETPSEVLAKIQEWVKSGSNREMVERVAGNDEGPP